MNRQIAVLGVSLALAALSLVAVVREVSAQSSTQLCVSNNGAATCFAVPATSCSVFGTCTSCDSGCPSYVPVSKICAATGGTGCTPYAAGCFGGFTQTFNNCNIFCVCPALGTITTTCASAGSYPNCF
jgi:hypothetical protein